MRMCWCRRRKPRRLGGGKGGESRLPREPKTLMRRLKKGLPAVAAPPAAGAAAPPPERAPERERVPMPAAVQVLSWLEVAVPQPCPDIPSIDVCVAMLFDPRMLP